MPRRVRDESGATVVEYGLLVALIAVVLIGAISSLGGSLQGVFTVANAALAGTSAPTVGGGEPVFVAEPTEPQPTDPANDGGPVGGGGGGTPGPPPWSNGNGPPDGVTPGRPQP